MPGLRFLPSLFCVCKWDLFSSLSKLTFCLVLSNDEKAGSYSQMIPSSMEKSSEHDRCLPVSPNKAERQNTSSMVFLLRCEVLYSKNASCMWHCKNMSNFIVIQLWSPIDCEMSKAVYTSKTDCFKVSTDSGRHSLLYLRFTFLQFSLWPKQE